MTSESHMSPELRKMRANRRVLESACSICNISFQLTEEVYQCSFCVGYHHVACWETTRKCPQQSDAPVSTGGSPTVPAMVVPALETTHIAREPEAGKEAEVTVQCPQCGQINSDSAARCACGYAFQPKSVTGEANKILAIDERLCPACAEVIKQKAIKCRFCGHTLDARLAEPIVQVPLNVANDIEQNARDALKFSIIGIFICGPILEPMALSRGYKALKSLRQYPSYASRSSARGKARAGVIIGWISLGLYILGILSRIVSP